MKLNVDFDEVLFLFEEHCYYIDSLDLFWYRYMWSILEKHGLTQYETDQEYYSVFFRAVALIYIYYGFISAKEGCTNLPDCIYEYCLTDKIPAFALGQLYANEINDDFITDESYAVYNLARKEYEPIRSAILQEMTFEQLLQTLYAVTYSEIHFVEEDGDEYEEMWSPQTYEEYFDLISNRLDNVDITDGYNSFATYDWVVVNEAYFDQYDY